MIKFSIIIVCYNAERKIGVTIDSVLKQIYSAIELIVIDGASTDNTINILEEYSKDTRLLYYSKKDTGIYNAMNRGIERVTGDYICFLNAGDVFYDKHVLQKIADGIRKTNLDIVIGSYIEKRHEVARLIRMNDVCDWKERLQRCIGICHQAIFAKATCLKDGFNEKYKIVSDYDWLCRKVNLGFKIGWIDVIVSEYDVYGVSGLAKNWKMTKDECYQVIRNNFPKIEEKVKYIIEEQYKNDKYQRTLECLNDILALKQRGKSIIEYFKVHSLNKIAIYGFHYLGQRLFAELEDSDIEVNYIIDRDHSFQNQKVTFKYIDGILEPVDAIVVTPIFEFLDIKKQLENVIQARIISIEDIINNMY